MGLIPDLEGHTQQYEVTSDAESYTRGIKSVQGVVKEQGQVMALALDNNQNLWDTNKKLRKQNADLLDRIGKAERHNAVLMAKLENAYTPTVEEFAEMRERVLYLEAANANLKDELIREQTPELDTEQRKARIALLKAQKDELFATGLVPVEVPEEQPTAEQIQ